MEERRRERKDFWQYIVITLLTVSAVVLFLQTQLYHLGAERYKAFFGISAAQADTAGSDSTMGLVAPVRVAVSNPYGRYADVAMRTDEESFSAPGRILREAFLSAGESAPCTEERFRAALNGTSVYYDFLNPLPLSVLSALTGAETAGEDTVARALAVSAERSGAALYLWDGGETYLRCETAVAADSLENAVNRFEMSGAYFAYESEMEGIAPYALFLQEKTELPSLREAVLNADVDVLLEALQFNPRTNYRYAESEGTEVVVEGSRTLRVHMDGSISYQSGGEKVLTVEAADHSLEALAEGTDRLLDSLLAAGGKENLYLQSIQRDGETVRLVYDYEVDGIPVRLFNGSHAADVTLSGTSVAEMEVWMRQYTAADSSAVLLPVRQAAAIARQYEKEELFIGYVGGGVGLLRAQWLVE